MYAYTLIQSKQNIILRGQFKINSKNLLQTSLIILHSHISCVYYIHDYKVHRREQWILISSPLHSISSNQLNNNETLSIESWKCEASEENGQRFSIWLIDQCSRETLPASRFTITFVSREVGGDIFHRMKKERKQRRSAKWEFCKKGNEGEGIQSFRVSRVSRKAALLGTFHSGQFELLIHREFTFGVVMGLYYWSGERVGEWRREKMVDIRAFLKVWFWNCHEPRSFVVKLYPPYFYRPA